MKKNVKVYLVIVIILLAIIGICIGFFINIKDNSPAWITDYEFLYDKAIQYVIKEETENSYDKNKENHKIFCDYEPFGIEEKGNKKYAYMWIIEEEYYVENYQVKSGEGSSMPYKFVFENNEVISYQVPRDGSEYGPSIKKIFPQSIEREVMSFSMDSSNLRKQVEEYYSYLQSSDIIMNAVIVRADKNGLMTVTLDDTQKLIHIGFTDDGDIGYKQGQEIEIHFDGIIDSMYPARISKPRKIKIIKEESNIEIPEYALRYCYSSKDNVNVEISELTNSGIYLKITDTNELKYSYSHKYEITKKVKNPDYTGVGYKIGEDTANSTVGYTRYWGGIYL